MESIQFGSFSENSNYFGLNSNNNSFMATSSDELILSEQPSKPTSANHVDIRKTSEISIFEKNDQTGDIFSQWLNLPGGSEQLTLCDLVDADVSNCANYDSNLHTVATAAATITTQLPKQIVVQDIQSQQQLTESASKLLKRANVGISQSEIPESPKSIVLNNENSSSTTKPRGKRNYSQMSESLTTTPVASSRSNNNSINTLVAPMVDRQSSSLGDDGNDTNQQNPLMDIHLWKQPSPANIRNRFLTFGSSVDPVNSNSFMTILADSKCNLADYDVQIKLFHKQSKSSKKSTKQSTSIRQISDIDSGLKYVVVSSTYGRMDVQIKFEELRSRAGTFFLEITLFCKTINSDEGRRDVAASITIKTDEFAFPSSLGKAREICENTTRIPRLKYSFPEKPTTQSAGERFIIYADHLDKYTESLHFEVSGIPVRVEMVDTISGFLVFKMPKSELFDIHGKSDEEIKCQYLDTTLVIENPMSETNTPHYELRLVSWDEEMKKMKSIIQEQQEQGEKESHDKPTTPSPQLSLSNNDNDDDYESDHNVDDDNSDDDFKYVSDESQSSYHNDDDMDVVSTSKTSADEVGVNSTENKTSETEKIVITIIDDDDDEEIEPPKSKKQKTQSEYDDLPDTPILPYVEKTATTSTRIEYIEIEEEEPSADLYCL